jgi:H+/Cl- antiporter ClcA
MAGALFALEVPHRMGLQYFEALSPATIASIVAVLTNRMVTGNDVTGYYEYPFLNSSLPSEIFTNAIFYGLFGAGLGIFYIKVVLYLKHFVHGMFHEHRDDYDGHDDDVHAKHAKGDPKSEEEVPLVDHSDFKSKMQQPPSAMKRLKSLFCFAIPHAPTRAGISGALAGLAVGVTGMFIPHVMFWGEAQLQNLIDKGRTPLPVFGHGDEPTAGLIALGYCLMDEESTEDTRQGFSLGCAATITLAKIFVTGLSLGTGIVGGHFWVRLFGWLMVGSVKTISHSFLVPYRALSLRVAQLLIF